MQETVSDFKSRIALLMRERETGKTYAIVGASRAHSCVVRKSKTYGRNAWDKPKTKHEKN
jgi:hypothetical protein